MSSNSTCAIYSFVHITILLERLRQISIDMQTRHSLSGQTASGHAAEQMNLIRYKQKQNIRQAGSHLFDLNNIKSRPKLSLCEEQNQL